MIRMNMGCGKNKIPGFINVDKENACEPDEVVDLEGSWRWPWANDYADEVWFIHSLEHMGQTPDKFLMIMKELYRICKHGAKVKITVPHPRSNDFISDPTHVRAITQETLHLFNAEQCRIWQTEGYANSPLALYCGVDFLLLKSISTPYEPYSTQFGQGKLTQEELTELELHQFNIIKQVEHQLVVRKGKHGHGP